MQDAQNRTKGEIRRELGRIAHRKGLRVLMAVESGSRAWGFESPDSDYDVRFIYARPAADYLKLSRPHEQIDWFTTLEVYGEDVEADFVGWDIYKAMHLLTKTNPSLMEWLSCDQHYVPEAPVVQDMRNLIAQHKSLRAAGHHYLSMAQSNWGKYIDGVERPRLKKYLYAVRPLLCAMFVIEHQQWPPIKFDELVNLVALSDWGGDVEALGAIIDLVEAKVNGTSELDEGPRIPALDQFLSRGLVTLRGLVDVLPTGEYLPRDLLDAILQEEVGSGTWCGTQHGILNR